MSNLLHPEDVTMRDTVQPCRPGWLPDGLWVVLEAPWHPLWTAFYFTFLYFSSWQLRGWVLIPPAAEKQGSEMSDILRELLCVSEKAANIARACRQQEALFQLLIEEKKEGEKNKKFTVDFKTLADVLVQEVIKQNMENKVRKVTAKVIAKYLPLWLLSCDRIACLFFPGIRAPRIQINK